MAAKRARSGWLRSTSTTGIHRLLGRLDGLWRTDGLSERQLYLWDDCLRELAFRRRRSVVADWCTCRFCMEPFPDEPDELEL